MISAKIAKLHLARHAFDSSNHVSRGNKELSFEIAEGTHVDTELETYEDRRGYRSMLMQQLRPKAASRAPRDDSVRLAHRPPSEPPRRDDYRARSRSIKRHNRSSGAARGSVDNDVGPIDAAIQFTPSSAVVAHKTKHVKVSLVEMQSLESCLTRTIDSQKRIVDALEFYSRQIADEKKVFVECRDAVHTMILKAQL